MKASLTYPVCTPEDADYEHPDGVTYGDEWEWRVHNVIMAGKRARRRAQNENRTMVVYEKQNGRIVWVRPLGANAPDQATVFKTETGGPVYETLPKKRTRYAIEEV